MAMICHVLEHDKHSFQLLIYKISLIAAQYFYFILYYFSLRISFSSHLNSPLFIPIQHLHSSEYEPSLSAIYRVLHSLLDTKSIGCWWPEVSDLWLKSISSRSLASIMIGFKEK